MDKEIDEIESADLSPGLSGVSKGDVFPRAAVENMSEDEKGDHVGDDISVQKERQRSNSPHQGEDHSTHITHIPDTSTSSKLEAITIYGVDTADFSFVSCDITFEDDLSDTDRTTIDSILQAQYKKGASIASMVSELRSRKFKLSQASLRRV
jgi:hypothetical protein